MFLFPADDVHIITALVSTGTQGVFLRCTHTNRHTGLSRVKTSLKLVTQHWSPCALSHPPKYTKPSSKHTHKQSDQVKKAYGCRFSPHQNKCFLRTHWGKLTKQLRKTNLTEMVILSSLTYPRVAPILYDFLSSTQHKYDILKDVSVFLDPIETVWTKTV